MLCKLGGTSFGFINSHSGVNLIKDKVYSVKKEHDENNNIDYYVIIDKDYDNEKVLTTLSEDELKTFFEV